MMLIQLLLHDLTVMVHMFLYIMGPILKGCKHCSSGKDISQVADFGRHVSIDTFSQATGVTAYAGEKAAMVFVTFKELLLF